MLANKPNTHPTNTSLTLPNAASGSGVALNATWHLINFQITPSYPTPGSCCRGEGAQLHAGKANSWFQGLPGWKKSSWWGDLLRRETFFLESEAVTPSPPRLPILCCITELYNCIFVPVGFWNIRTQCIIPRCLCGKFCCVTTGEKVVWGELSPRHCPV